MSFTSFHAFVRTFIWKAKNLSSGFTRLQTCSTTNIIQIYTELTRAMISPAFRLIQICKLRRILPYKKHKHLHKQLHNMQNLKMEKM